VRDAFTPTPPPPVEYQVVRWNGVESADPNFDRLGGLGYTMTILAKDGWRFLANTPDGMLMGRNHKQVIEVAGKVDVRSDDFPASYYTPCCNHVCHHEEEEEKKDPRVFRIPTVSIPEKPPLQPFCDGIVSMEKPFSVVKTKTTDKEPLSVAKTKTTDKEPLSVAKTTDE
jgi:hypothetical protein